MKKLYVLAHKYPPFSGVGANRWWHLSNALVKKGVEVTILTVDRGVPPVLVDGLSVEYIKSDPFYKFLAWSSSNKWLNIILTAMKELLRRLFWYDDEAQYLGRSLVSKLRRIVAAEGRIVMVATGHPFQANYWAAVAKKEMPESIFLMQDFRDPWAQNPFKKYLFSWQKSRVESCQSFSMLNSDVNVFVTEGLKQLMSPERGVVIGNGHSISSQLPREKVSGNYIVHAGTLANGRDVVAEPFFQLCLEYPDILAGKQVRFYGRVSLWLIKKYSVLFEGGDFCLFSPVPQEQLYEIVRGASFALQFNAEEYPYLVSTKIYEYPALGVPTLSVNCGGEVSELIVGNNLGASSRANKKDIARAFEKLSFYTGDDDLNKFSEENSFSVRADQLLKLIQARQ